MTDETTELPVGAALQPDGTVIYFLAYPITINVGGSEKSISEVTVRRKRMDDNMAISKMTDGAAVACELIIRLTGIEKAAAMLMDDVDSEAIGAIIQSFTTPGRPTGSSASA